MKCPRCNNELSIHTMSRFNLDEICPECITREMAHPLYRAAREAEQAAVKSGDLGFPGVGCPPELYVTK